MKTKKRLTILLSVLLVVCMAAGLAACRFVLGDEEHVHIYTKWAYDETQHWKVCPEDGVMDPETKSDHEFVEGVCVCGATEAGLQHQHTYDAWDYDETQHWKYCDEHGDDKSNIDETTRADHNFESGDCECGAPKPHVHDYSKWEHDATQHWKVCPEDNEMSPEGKSDHNFDTQQHDANNHWMECSCGEKDGVTAHSFDTQQHDTTNHWMECSCGEKQGETAHNFDTQNHDTANHWTECTCGAKQGETAHSFDIPKHDTDNHWMECSCGAKQGETAHTFDTQQHDANNHWMECSCGAKQGETAHSFDTQQHDTTNHWMECSCGAKQGETPHSFEVKHNATHHWTQCTCGEKTGEVEHDFGGDGVCTQEGCGVVKLPTLVNDTNQMLHFNNQGQLEIDRQKNGDGSNKTAFTDGVDRVVFYVYTSTDADRKTGSVGSFVLKKGDTGNFVIALGDGTVVFSLNGNAGDLFTGANFAATFYDLLFRAVPGYDPNTKYYLAAQACSAEGTDYVSGDISEIGPTAFVEFTEPVEKLPTPANNENQMIRFAANGALELDRQGTTVLEKGGGSAIYYVYTSTEANKDTDSVGKFLLKQRDDGAWVLALEDGTPKVEMKGSPGNFYTDVEPKQALYGLLAEAVEAYDPYVSYYFAVQAISKYDSIEDSDISEIGPTAFLEFTERVDKLPTPANDANQMLRFAANGALELDRQKNGDGSKKSAFDSHVDFIKFYIYTSPSADRESDAVGTFILKADNGWVVTLEDGTVMLNVEGGTGNFWIDTAQQPDGQRFTKGHFFRLLEAAIGDGYSKTQDYYIAAQACSRYASITASDISEIGPSAFREGEESPASVLTIARKEDLV